MIDDFLEQYKIHLADDYTTISHILNMLPLAYVYEFTVNLLENDEYLYTENTETGITINGYIYYENKSIILETNTSKQIVLLKLPPSYEI